MERLGPLHCTRHGCPDAAGTAVLLHGIGLGSWFWEPWLPHFADARLDVVSVTLPGHEPEGRAMRLADAIAEVEAALDTLPGPVTLVGHSLGGLVAQIVATRRALRGLALVCPLPPGQVPWRPPLTGARAGWRLLHPLLRGRPLAVSWASYRAVGLANMVEAEARALYERVVPWPHGLVRDLVGGRPAVDPLAVKAPVLVALGVRDTLVPWERARLLGDLYEGVVWRYDDLGHMPPWEPGGERMGRDLAAWCASPKSPQVLESEGFGPAEGVGHALRRERRGEEMKRRSAYGQKKSAHKKG